ncbi:hypothetical protein COOONC_21901 [Cooperia oncophora]
MFREAEEEGQEVDFTYAHIIDFLKLNPIWKGTVRINETGCGLNEPSCLSSFLFTTGFTTLSSYKEMFPLIQEWRAIGRRHRDLGVYAYSERSTYADQSDALGDVIWQTLYSEVICMGLAFLVFIPDLVSILAGMLSLLSVNLGTPREKLEDAYLNIGWPTMQGGLSTLFAMLPILIKPSYLGLVFLKLIKQYTLFWVIQDVIEPSRKPGVREITVTVGQD